MTRRKKQKIISGLLVAVFLSCSFFIFEYFHTSYELDENIKVIRVIDGDTMVVDFEGAEETVRFIGIDTPESVHPEASKNVPYGTISSEYTKKRLEGKNVALEFDVLERDKYGRLLAYVYIDKKMINKELLEKGHAKVATFPPNVKYVEEFTEIEKEAKKEKRGMWKNDEFN